MLADDSVTFDAWKLPKGETHLQSWMWNAQYRKNGRLTYQAHKFERAIEHVKQRRVAVDIGAHVGLWSFLMAHEFESTVAIEPHPLHAALWRDNMAGLPATLHECAVGDKAGGIGLENYTPGSSGDTRVNGAGNIPMITLDSLGLDDVDFIKIDCEGFERQVIMGALETIKRCRPVIVVEQKPGKGGAFGQSDCAAVELLETVGYKARDIISGDYIMIWA